LKSILAAGEGTTGAGPSAVRIEIDSKAMRKIHLTDNLVGMVEATDEVGVSVVTAVLQTRMLLKLP